MLPAQQQIQFSMLLITVSNLSIFWKLHKVNLILKNNSEKYRCVYCKSHAYDRSFKQELLINKKGLRSQKRPLTTSEDKRS